MATPSKRSAHMTGTAPGNPVGVLVTNRADDIEKVRAEEA
jgi:hypothetical protein